MREWGTQRTYALYSDHADPTIGTAPDCQIQVHDQTRRVSRQHALIQRVDRAMGRARSEQERALSRWCQAGSCSSLTPGVELGPRRRRTLVAESACLIALRSAPGPDAPDGAPAPRKRSIQRRARSGSRGTTPDALVLCGADLVPLAAELHRLTPTAARPFVLCNAAPQYDQSTWNPTRCAATGTACARRSGRAGRCAWTTQHLPSDLRDLMQVLRRPGCQTQLVVRSEREAEAEVFNVAPIVVPPLTSCKDEIDRLIEEYARDAAGPLELGPHRLSPPERTWIKR